MDPGLRRDDDVVLVSGWRQNNLTTGTTTPPSAPHRCGRRDAVFVFHDNSTT
jgi:hypothetical protein